MKATEIPVVEFAEYEDAMVQERNALAKKAHKQLGYKLLAQTINPAANLLAALKHLDVRPLSRMGVEQYKLSKEKIFMRYSTAVLALCWLLVVPIAPLATASLGWYMHITQFELSTPPFWMGLSMAALGTLSVTVFGVMCSCTWGDDPYRTVRTRRHWKRYAIAEYAGAIPEFALQKALQIKEACPAAEFFIDQLVTEVDRQDEEKLRDNRERVLRMRDPFLVAVTKDETYYIEVWDEKEYESKL